jgi:hypothetical protein
MRLSPSQNSKHALRIPQSVTLAGRSTIVQWFSQRTNSSIEFGDFPMFDENGWYLDTSGWLPPSLLRPVAWSPAFSPVLVSLDRFGAMALDHGSCSHLPRAFLVPEFIAST